MLDLIEHGDLAEVRLNRSPANALNAALVMDLTDALRQVIANGAAGVTISGQPGMFSAGLDVPELLPLPRSAIREFWELFFGLMRTVATSPVPVAAAITGHSPAGGAVIAVHCDFRVAAEGEFKIGFNEVRVGLPVPSTILAALTDLVGPRQARRLAVEGLLIEPDEAHAIGLVDELAPVADTVLCALQWCREIVSLPPVAMNETRRQSKAGLLANLARAGDAEAATNYWFSEETQREMHRLVERLK
jgi:3,2-trans-enoyl-CoA isomerase